MIINQVYSGFGPLGLAFKKKLGIPLYKDITKPVLFFGCYGSQIDKALKNTSTVVIIWAGSDIMGFMKDKEKVAEVKARDNIKHIAISKFISNDLTSIGFEHKCIPIAAQSNMDIYPFPLGDSVYVYKPHLYGRAFVDYAKEKLPHINFIGTTFHDHDRQGILDVYKKCFIGLRAIPHDGLSNTVVEMGLMGRRCVWNGGTPNALPYETKDDVVRLIESEYENRYKLDWEQTAIEMRKYMTAEDFLDLDIWI